jgi:hypothetical protein
VVLYVLYVLFFSVLVVLYRTTSKGQKIGQNPLYHGRLPTCPYRTGRKRKRTAAVNLSSSFRTPSISWLMNDWWCSLFFLFLSCGTGEEVRLETPNLEHLSFAGAPGHGQLIQHSQECWAGHVEASFLSLVLWTPAAFTRKFAAGKRQKQESHPPWNSHPVSGGFQKDLRTKDKDQRQGPLPHSVNSRMRKELTWPISSTGRLLMD